MWLKCWNLSVKKVENILGKGQNAGYQHFLLFPKCFQSSFLLCRYDLGLSGQGSIIAITDIGKTWRYGSYT